MSGDVAITVYTPTCVTAHEPEILPVQSSFERATVGRVMSIWTWPASVSFRRTSDAKWKLLLDSTALDVTVDVCCRSGTLAWNQVWMLSVKIRVPVAVSGFDRPSWLGGCSAHPEQAAMAATASAAATLTIISGRRVIAE